MASVSEVFSGRSADNNGAQITGTSDGANGAVAFDVSAGTLRLQGTNNVSSGVALLLEATLTDAAITRAPVTLTGGSAGTNFATVIGEQFWNHTPCR